MIRDFKELHKETPDKTYVCISHGAFLKQLLALVTNQPKKHEFSACKNNSLTILEFTTERNEFQNLDYIQVKMLSYNLQLIDEVESIIKIEE